MDDVVADEENDEAMDDRNWRVEEGKEKLQDK